MERATGIGFWQLTLLMVVIASWLLYRYVAPRGGRERSRAGLVAAFLIALFAGRFWWDRLCCSSAPGCGAGGGGRCPGRAERGAWPRSASTVWSGIRSTR